MLLCLEVGGVEEESDFCRHSWSSQETEQEGEMGAGSKVARLGRGPRGSHVKKCFRSVIHPTPPMTTGTLTASKGVCIGVIDRRRTWRSILNGG